MTVHVAFLLDIYIQLHWTKPLAEQPDLFCVFTFCPSNLKGLGEVGNIAVGQESPWLESFKGYTTIILVCEVSTVLVFLFVCCKHDLFLGSSPSNGCSKLGKIEADDLFKDKD